MAHADTAYRLTEGRGTSRLTAYVHGHAGRHAEARIVIEQLMGRSASEYIAPYDVAQANPAFDPFRADPRWHVLVDRMGLKARPSRKG